MSTGEPIHFRDQNWQVQWAPIDQQPPWIVAVLTPLTWIFMLAFAVSSLLDIAVDAPWLTVFSVLSGIAWIATAFVVIKSRKNRSRLFF